ncbi:MAG: hypothetical protein RJS97_00715 [Parvibaculaceae bacterium]
MIPKGQDGINQIRTAVQQVLIPDADNIYTAANLHYLCELIKIISTDYDRAADIFVRENESLKEIFKDARKHTDSSPLMERLSDAVELQSKSLRISDLTARADHTLQLLIDLHDFIEREQYAGAAWAHELNLLIWKFLETYVAGRNYQ